MLGYKHMRIYFLLCRSSRWRIWTMIVMVFSAILLFKSFPHLPGNMVKGVESGNDKRELNNITRTNKTISTKAPKIICEIPSVSDLNSTYEANVNSITFDILEPALFGESYQEVLSLLKRTGGLLVERLKSQARTDEKNYTIEKEYFDGDIVKIGNYDYLPGGRWRPSDCNPKWKYNSLLFNRGLMKNVGYRGATRFGDWNCVIFHDIDLVPMKGGNYYGCDNFPRHLAAYTEQFKYRLPYETIFGGVVGLTAEQVRLSNGYSNAYWGWGGEDDELFVRLKRRGINITRETEHGYYRSLQHKKKLKKQLCPEVNCLYNNFQLRADWEGINNMTYSIKSLELFPLYTKISVDVQKEVWNSNMKPCESFSNHEGHQHDK
ncbi:beta-1,4-galactosyltransferase 6-like isoform X2 [Strongylocentrotus purpuratus]|uniref:Beta-1,4-galactosyltransferase n=1 Tax=Strongylocentrotus purpuratus TaxID=7668 RepID=A0A7M7NKZ4_STRPU|nr:beta-1,4-galactosyltransferase 6-like isoform X2 [Strongylocentrotus purpuratus]